MRSSELKRLEAQRAATKPVVRRDVKPAKVSLRAQVEQEFRDMGAKVFREERSR